MASPGITSLGDFVASFQPIRYPALSAAVALLVVIWSIRTLTGNSSHLPPGPRGLPLLGNLLSLSVDDVWIKYCEWSKQHGDVMTVSILGSSMIVLNSAQATSDLLEQRSSNYSDRPEMPMVIDLMGWDWTFALMRYGPRWREYRRVFHNHFYARMGEHQQIAKEEVQTLLADFSRSPLDNLQHLKRYTAAIIMTRVYGHRIAAMNDPYIELVERASESTSLATVPGAFLVNVFPSMIHIPEWLPGGGFKKQAREWRKLSEDMVEVPYQMVKTRMASGTAESCYVSTSLEKLSDPQSEGPLREDLIKHTAAVAYAAGADTTFSALTTFILAMTLHPDVQKRAQFELDAVLGHDRLPTFEDREALPYISAVLKEVLRWIPVLPLGVPHRSVKEDIYHGLYIPAGSVIVPNVWAILHNEEIFKQPSQFIPERFMEDATLPDPADSGIFGFGRRACAGKGMALDTLWIAVASILAAFDISQVRDEQGNEITPEVKLQPGAICHLQPFKCTITPRSTISPALLEQFTERSG